jgi:hypothetical protein
MYSALDDTDEWLDEGELSPEPSPEHIPVELEPVDYRILTLLFKGERMEGIAEILHRTRAEVAARASRPRFLHLQRQVEKGVVERVTRSGEFEPVSVAKASATAAMQRIIQQSKTVQDPRVFLAANKEVLRMAGCEPPKRIEITTPDKVLDQMTPAELEHFAATREWPTRFQDQLAQFMKYGDGGEVTLSETKSVTVKSIGNGNGGNGKPSQLAIETTVIEEEV